MVQRLFILADPRSGSTWLMETLNSSPDIRLEPELLNPEMHPEAVPFIGLDDGDLEQAVSYLEKHIRPETGRWRGTKLLIPQLFRISPQFPRYFLTAYRKARFILLVRRNLVRAQISVQLAHAHGVWHVKDERRLEARTVRVHPPSFVTAIRNKRRMRDALLAGCDDQGLAVMRVAYEDLFASPEQKVAEIAAFLQLRLSDFRFSGEIKANPFPLRDVVENYGELVEYLQPDSELSSMLDES